jgi:hypothetical protein
MYTDKCKAKTATGGPCRNYAMDETGFCNIHHPKKKQERPVKVKKTLECSFCGKKQNEVEKLIAGPSVYICNKCVEICIKIVWDDKGDIVKVLTNELPIGDLGVNPVFLRRKFTKKVNQAFVLCPFREPFDTIYNDHIMPALSNAGLSSIRADDIYGVDPIMEDVWAGINESSVVIAEITGRNANVMYEVGIAHTIGKPVILLTQDVGDVPFDLRHYRFVHYEYTQRGCKQLEKAIHKTVEAVSFLWVKTIR